MAREQPPLEEMTLRQLRKVASDYNISRYSRMRKEQLLEEILKKAKTEPSSPSSTTTSIPVAPMAAFNTLKPITTPEADVKSIESKKFDLGEPTPLEDLSLADVDHGLPELPSGYGDSRIVLMPRDPQWAYAYWDIPNDHKEELRRQGGQQLALRIYDVTDRSEEHTSELQSQ